MMAAVLALQARACDAGPNASTTIVLHTVGAEFLSCGSAGDPCAPHTLNTEMAIGVPNVVFVYVRNYDNVSYVQTAFEWPLGWTRLAGSLCQVSFGGMLPISPGPDTGTLINTFDCITGGASAVVAVLSFIPTGPGCLEQVESAFPRGTHVLSCSDEVDNVAPQARGRVCAGSAGTDACEFLTPTEDTTWGSIKQQYQQ